MALGLGIGRLRSGEALAGIVGPLVEVPALVALVYLPLWLRRRLHGSAPRRAVARATPGTETASAAPAPSTPTVAP